MAPDAATRALSSSLTQPGARVLLCGIVGDTSLAADIAGAAACALRGSHPLQFWLSGSSEASVLLGLAEFGRDVCSSPQLRGGTAVSAGKALLEEKQSWLIVIEDVPTDPGAICALLSHFPAGRGHLLLITPNELPSDAELLSSSLTDVQALGLLSQREAVNVLLQAAGVRAGGLVDPTVLQHAVGRLQGLPASAVLLGRLLSGTQLLAEPGEASAELATFVQTRASFVIDAALDFAPTNGASPGWLALQFGRSHLRGRLREDDVTQAEVLLYTVALLAAHGAGGVDCECFLAPAEEEAGLPAPEAKSARRGLRKQVRHFYTRMHVLFFTYALRARVRPDYLHARLVQTGQDHVGCR